LFLVTVGHDTRKNLQPSTSFAIVEPVTLSSKLEGLSKICLHLNEHGMILRHLGFLLFYEHHIVYTSTYSIILIIFLMVSDLIVGHAGIAANPVLQSIPSQVLMPEPHDFTHSECTTNLILEGNILF